MNNSYKNSRHYVTGNFADGIRENGGQNGAMSKVNWDIKLDTDNKDDQASISGNHKPKIGRIGLK